MSGIWANYKGMTISCKVNGGPTYTVSVDANSNLLIYSKTSSTQKLICTNKPVCGDVLVTAYGFDATNITDTSGEAQAPTIKKCSAVWPAF